MDTLIGLHGQNIEVNLWVTGLSLIVRAETIMSQNKIEVFMMTMDESERGFH